MSDDRTLAAAIWRYVYVCYNITMETVSIWHTLQYGIIRCDLIPENNTASCFLVQLQVSKCCLLIMMNKRKISSFPGLPIIPCLFSCNNPKEEGQRKPKSEEALFLSAQHCWLKQHATQAWTDQVTASCASMLAIPMIQSDHTKEVKWPKTLMRRTK